MDIIVGIVGSILGGWIAGVVTHTPQTGIWSFIWGIIGAVVLLLILRALTGRRRVA